MAASRVALKRLSSLILSGSPRSVISRSGSLRPGTLQAASRSFSANAEEHDPFNVVCGMGRESQGFADLHHEHTLANLRDGFHVCLYMIGVGKGDVKVWMEGGELIAEGIKEKDIEREEGIETMYRYRMLGPPDVLYDRSAMKAEIKNGLLRVFVPRRNQNMFIPTEC